MEVYIALKAHSDTEYILIRTEENFAAKTIYRHAKFIATALR